MPLRESNSMEVGLAGESSDDRAPLFSPKLHYNASIRSSFGLPITAGKHAII